MIDIKNVLEIINQIIIIPISLVTFFLLIYIVIYLNKKDPDVIRSKIFLKYREIKKAFIMLIIFAFLLIFHVSLIYIPQLFEFTSDLITLMEDLQLFFGLFLVLTLVTFAITVYRSIK